MQKKTNYKHEHMESQILNILNHTLKHVIYDEFIKFTSFTAVRLSNDNSLAIVYIDTYNRDIIKKLVNKLNDSKGIFKNELAKNMFIRKIPDIKFEIDETLINADNIEKILSTQEK